MPHPVIDLHVVGVDETGDPWNAGNPVPVSLSGSITGTVESTDVLGAVIVAGTSYEVKQSWINFTTLGPSTMVAAVTGKRVRVIAFYLWPSLNTKLEWRSAATVIIQAQTVAGGVQFGDCFLPGYWTQTGIGESLILRQAVTTPAEVRGVIHYIEYV